MKIKKTKAADTSGDECTWCRLLTIRSMGRCSSPFMLAAFAGGKMSRYNYQLARAKAEAADEKQKRKCQICGSRSTNCIYKENEIGHTIYCVCPTCFMWSDEKYARFAREDKRRAVK